MHVVSLFINHRPILFAIPADLFTGTKSQFVSNLFSAVLPLLGVRHFTTTSSSHQQTNSQAKRLKKNHSYRLPAALHCRTPKRLKHHFPNVTYLRNAQIHHSTKQTRFKLALSCRAPKPTLSRTTSALSADGYAETSPHLLRSRLKARIPTQRAKVETTIASAR